MLILLSCYLVLQNKQLQHSVVIELTESLSQQVDSKVSIDQIEWNFPNSFVLKDVYVEDQKGDTLLFVDRTKVTINILKLLSSQISFRTVQFTDMKANLRKDTSDVLNFQFFFDALRPKEKDDTLSLQWSMDIESVAFDNCAVSYLNPNKTTQIGRFEPNDVSIYDIKGCMFVRSFTEDSVYVLLEEMSLEEKSGLVLEDLSLTLTANREKINVSNFKMQTPNSSLFIDEFSAYHKNYKAFKQPLTDLRLMIEIAPSKIQLSDFSALNPSLDMLTKQVTIEGGAYGFMSKLQLHNLKIAYGNSTKLYGNVYLENLFPDPQKLFFDATVEKLSSSSEEISDVMMTFIDREIALPRMLDSLGVFTYAGEAKGTLLNLQANGNITSNLGQLEMKVGLNTKDLLFNTYTVKGGIMTRSCHLNRLFGNKSELGNTAFKLDVLLEKVSDRHFALDANGAVDSFTYKNYCYQNIRLNGRFDEEGFNGKLIMSDKNAEVSFEGKMDLRKKIEKPLFHFVASVRKTNLSKLNLIKKYNDAIVSFDVETNFVGKTLEDLEGYFSMDNIVFAHDDKELVINNLSISASLLDHEKKKLSIYSDYLNGTVEGKYMFTTIPNNLYNIAHSYLPSIIKTERDMDPNRKKNEFVFNFKVENMEPINDAYEMPFVILEESKLSGFYNDSTNRFRVRLESPQMRYGNKMLGNIVFLCENPTENLKIIARTTFLPKNKRRNPYYISLTTNTQNDTLNFNFNFNNSTDVTYGGTVSAKAIFKDFIKGEGLTADFLINPTSIIINDTIWNVHQSKISLDKKYLKIDSFYFNHKNQFLRIAGESSTSESDSINIHFSDLHLGYISDIINNKDISFNGVADGDIFFFQPFNNPHFKGDLYVYDTEINNHVIGDMSVNSSWKEKEKCIAFDAKLLSLYKEKLYRSDVNGGVFLGNDSLYIAGDLNNVDLKFLRQYLKSVVQNNTGTACGKIKAYGKFGHIGLEGVGYVKDMAFDVNYLKTSYVLSDSVYLTPNTIRLNQTQVFDTDGNHAIASGLLLHDGFRNFKFAFDINCNNLLALNTQEEDNSTFYGKAYVQGNAHLSGVPELVNIKLNLRSKPNTNMTIPLEGTSSAKEGNFISFVELTENKSVTERRRIRREKLNAIKESKSSQTEINIDVNLDATPDAQIQLIMDPQQGDIIRANGSGNLQMTYNTRSNNFKMYGSYEIEKGDYLFTIQSIISRKFDINTGSTVRWTGDPYNAFIDIQAKYGLNASLTDIIEDPNLRSASTPVHCLLNLSGTINSPVIKFDIDLPNSDDDVRSKLKSVINTEEAMNRNIASLMALGHFYTMDKTATTSTTSELSSVGFSTLSSQLTNWISKLNQDINIGLNYRPTSTGVDGTSTSSEFDVALSTQMLNDRLLLNGNFGYRDEVTNSENISNSIVDFDLEYKLSNSGKLRAKGFNRSNNSYFKQSANTQGVGLIYREEFDTFGGLMKSYWNSLVGIFQKEDKKKVVEKKDNQ